MKRVLAFSGLAASMLVMLSGCATMEDATAIAQRISQNIEGAQVITITAANDELNRFAGDNPPASVAVIKLPGVECAKLGVACGAEIEVAAQEPKDPDRRAQLLQAMLRDSNTPVDLWYDGGTTLYLLTNAEPVSRAMLSGAFGGKHPELP